jgi:GYF domain 2
MFKILGADGKEYGPVTADQIKKWITEGRANRETQAQQTGDSNWRPLAQFPDFAEVLGVVPPVVAPPPGAPAPIASAASGTDAGAHARAKDAVSGPAIGLMVTAGLGVAGGLVGLVLTLARWGAAPEMPGMDPQLAHMIQVFAYGPLGIVTKIVGLAISLFVLYGAIKMQKLAGYGFALAAAIVALIPCFSPCCLIGLPIGIWALVVLSKPEVKSQFE